MKKRLIILFIALFLLSMLFFWCIERIFPLVKVHSQARVRNIAYSILSKATLEVMQREGNSYDDLVELIRDSEGNISAISTKSENVNILKSDIIKSILENVDSFHKEDISIPLGNLTGSILFSGRGPRIKVRILKANSIKANLNTSFSSVGINQTRHTLILDVSFKIQVSVLRKSFTVEAEDSIVIADTVIVGKVPDGYTAINKASDDLIGDIVDFKAE